MNQKYFKTLILSGLKIKKGNTILILFITFLIIFSCQNEYHKKEIVKDNNFQIIKNDTLIISIELFENGILKSVSSVNHLGNKNGIQMEYHPNGVLKEKFFSVDGYIYGELVKFNELGQQIISQNYEHGIKSGNMFEFSNESILNSHILYKNNQAIYVGVYEEGKRIINSLLPVFENEVISKDSVYEARLVFPYPYNGSINIFLKDTVDFNIEYLEKHILNLTITNYNKSWVNYEMLIEYQPGEVDSLIWTEQVYKRSIINDFN